MHVLHVTDGLGAARGGTAAACAQLAATLARSSVGVAVLMCGPEQPSWPLGARVSTGQCLPAVPRRLGFCPRFTRVARALPPPALVHIHGLWRLHYWQAASYARRVRVPTVVSVHGMLYGAALAERALLKRAARRLFQDRLLQDAGCLHATASQEVAEIRRAGFSAPIALIPWGVDPPPRDRPGPRDGAASRKVVYLGRLHPRKGVDLLLRAWARVRRDDARLVIAGGDSDGCGTALRTLAADLGIDGSVEWRDLVAGEARERLFGEAALVVLPSAYENFGLVVGEALARGVPAIATRGTPWPRLAERRCGWWIDHGVEPLAAALADALGRSDAELRAMGERGRRLAAAELTWDTAACAMRRLYEWLVGSGPRPAFVDER